MKRTKLSLCALIATGMLSHLNAQSSQEALLKALEDVEFSGFGRLIYKVEKPKDSDTSESLRFSSQLNAVYKLHDDLFAGVTLAADGLNYPDSDPSEPINGYKKENNKGIYVDRWYFKYLISDFTITGGKQDLTSPWTETGFNSSRGNGLSALYKGISDWTFAGAVFLQTNGFDDTNLYVDGSYTPDLGSSHNYYAAGVTGNFKDIGLDVQLWGGAYENIMEAMVYTDVRYSIGGFRIRGQANYAKINTDFASRVDITGEEGIYYGLELRYNANDLFYVKGEYTKNDKDQPFYTFDGDNIGFLTTGEYEAVNVANAKRYSVSIGKKFGNLNAELTYHEFDSDASRGTKSSNGESLELTYLYGKLYIEWTLEYNEKTRADETKTKSPSSNLELIYRF
jgi:hypothetical protein